MSAPLHVSDGNVVYRERRDTGGMFDATLGVVEWEGKYHAFVSDWGGGYRGPAKDTEQAARDDIERLFEKTYGAIG